MKRSKLTMSILTTCLVASFLTGCDFPQLNKKETTEATTEGKVSKFSVSDDEVGVETASTEASQTAGITKNFSMGTSLAGDKDCGILEMFADNDVYLMCFDNGELSKAIFESTTGRESSFDITFDIYPANDENTALYERICSVLEKNGSGMYGKVSKNVLTLEGAKPTDTYNFTICKPSAISIKDAQGNVLVQNGMDANEVTKALAPEQSSQDKESSEETTEETSENTGDNTFETPAE